MTQGLTGLLGGFDDPKTLGLLGVAAPLLRAGGYSQTPVSLGQALGAGLQGGVQGYQMGRQSQQLGQMREMQLAEMQRAQKQREAQAAAFQRIVSPGMTPEMTGGPTRANAAALPNARFTPDQLAMLEAMGPEAGMQVLASQTFRKQDPIKLGANEELRDPNNPERVIASGPRPDRTPKIGDTRRIANGNQEITQEWDGQKWTQIGTGPRWQPDSQLMAVPDSTSPTGFRYVPRAQALNQPAMGPSGLSIDFGPDGRPKSIMSGPGGGRTNPGNPANLSQSTIGSLEEAAANAANQLSRLDSIAQSFRPEYLEVVPRGQAAWSSIRERMGANLSPQQREQLASFTAFRRETVANLNQTIKDITGAAMTEAEAGRLSQQVPVAGTGIFDGDSPTEFKSKLDGAVKSARNSLMRANWARMNGLDPLKSGVSLEEVPGLVEKRGAEIEAAVRGEMPGADPGAVLQEVRKRLGREFGMVR